MKKKSTLILSTIKTVDSRISERADKQIIKADQLLKNLFSVNPDVFEKVSITEIIIYNNNFTEITQKDFDQYLIKIKKKKIFNNEIIQKFKNAIIINQKHSKDAFAQIFNNKSYIYYLFQEFLDPRLLFLIIRTNKDYNIKLINPSLNVIRNNVKQSLTKIFNNISDKDDEFMEIDEFNLYEKSLIDIIDQSYLKEIKTFLTNRPKGVFYYIYGNDELLVNSLVDKLREKLPKYKTTIICAEKLSSNDIQINDFIILSTKEIEDEELLQDAITLHNNANKTILIIHNSLKRAFISKTPIYIPNYKESKSYHTSMFLYFALPRISDLKLHNHFYSLHNAPRLETTLEKFNSVKEMQIFVEQIPFEKLKRYKEEDILDYLAKMEMTFIDSNANLNKIKQQGNEYIFYYQSNEYTLKANSGVKLIVSLLKNPKDYKPSELSSKIRSYSNDAKEDYEALRSAFYRAIKGIETIESNKNITDNLLSKYLKENIKFIQKIETYIISSVKIKPQKWSIS